MIVDTSAVAAIILGEPDAHDFASALSGAIGPKISAATLLELAMVIDGRRSPALSRKLNELIATSRLTVADFTRAQSALARLAFGRFGRGMGHKAQLNFGDCFAYALAIETGEPLLFKGGDFRHTDLTPVF